MYERAGGTREGEPRKGEGENEIQHEVMWKPGRERCGAQHRNRTLLCGNAFDLRVDPGLALPLDFLCCREKKPLSFLLGKGKGLDFTTSEVPVPGPQP